MPAGRLARQDAPARSSNPVDGEKEGKEMTDDDDIQVELDIVPLTVESARRFGIGRRLLEHAMRYLEQRYGSQEAAAIELLKEEWKAGGD